MYNYKLTLFPKSTVEIIVIIPKEDISKEYEAAFMRLQKEVVVEGFRKGKAPKAVAEKKIGKETIYQDLIKSVLPRLYEEIVKKEGLKPIISPKVELVLAKEGKDWEIKIKLAQKPKLDLGDYKKVVKDLKSSKKKGDIWIPGKTAPKKEEVQDKQKILNEILAALLRETKYELSDLIIDEELNQRLAQLLDDIQKIGLTVEAYLKSKNLTMDELKKRFKQEIEDTYKLEFVLLEIADREGIKVEQADIDKLLAAINDEKERAKARDNSYFYASVLRKQKTLDFLLSL